MASICLLLDMANLWDSCRAQYGKRARVNFKVLLDKAKTRKTDTVKPYAFVLATPDKNQDNLLKKLEEMGVATYLVTESNLVPIMRICVKGNVDEGVDKVVVASSNPALREVIAQANGFNKETMLLAFAEALDKELANEADDIKLLTKADTIQQ